MAILDRPKPRSLPVKRIDHEGQPYALIHDPTGAFTNPVPVLLHAFVHVCRHFDGRSALRRRTCCASFASMVFHSLDGSPRDS